MKKFILAALSLAVALPSMAQLSSGFYRIQNVGSSRYITITDNKIGSVDMSSTEADLSNITTWRGFDHVKSAPSSILYIEPVGSQYNLSAQGVSVYEIAGGRAYIDITGRDNNTKYILSASAKGVTVRLYDTSKSSEEGYVLQTGSGDYMYWYIKPVDTADNYLGLTPTVEAKDGYYGTIYADFPFKAASTGLSFYYIDGVKEGVFQLKEINSEYLPAKTPMVFKCSSSDAKNNMITPQVYSSTTPTDNLLGGTLFASSTRGHIVRVEYDKSTMRVLGVDSDKNLIFTTASKSYLTDNKYIPMNTCWLTIPSSLSGDFKLVSRDDFTGIRNIESDADNANAATYTLTGVKVESKNPKPGIYIRNGKKIVVK